MISIGCFVSSHGFGHATRMAAVLEALSRRVAVMPHIFTTVQKELFTQTLQHFSYHRHFTDIGFIQSDAFHIDLEATCRQLGLLLPYRDDVVDRLAEVCRDCSLILCDISGLGVKVAARLQIPSVLIENFTWDWLYAPYEQHHPDIGYFSDYLAKTFKSADYRIQTEPNCSPVDADLRCSPIFRRTRQDPAILREKLKCGDRPLILITLGGIGLTPRFLSSLQKFDSCFFVFGGQEKALRLSDNVQLLDRFSDLYHPDLIACADIVVFKSGYSTLAECYQCGKPSLCIQRQGFGESKVLENFAVEKMGSVLLSQKDFLSGMWLAELPNISLKGCRPARSNGADEVADFLAAKLL